jgi:hypothetical protein
MLLTHWIDTHSQSNTNMNFLVILCDCLKIETNAQDNVANAEDLEFKTHHGWLERFKTHANLHSLQSWVAWASTDVAAAMKFPEELNDNWRRRRTFTYADFQCWWDGSIMTDDVFLNIYLLRRTESTRPQNNYRWSHTTLPAANFENDIKIKLLFIHYSQKPWPVKG